MSITGILIWWRRRQAGPNIRHNSAAQTADTVILVGSETNSTWGFANTLHEALHQAGHRVHSAAMNQYANDYGNAQRVLILTATHGDGNAPASASQFLARLAEAGLKPGQAFAVLGFGDRQFAQFCQFAHQVQEALLQASGTPLIDLETINRQSSQEFARWGHAVGEVLGHDLTLTHTPQPPRTHQLILVERIAYGEQVGAPTHVLRFKHQERYRPLKPVIWSASCPLATPSRGSTRWPAVHKTECWRSAYANTKEVCARHSFTAWRSGRPSTPLSNRIHNFVPRRALIR